MTDKAKKYIARAPVNLGGRDFRPGDTIDDEVEHKLIAQDLEAGRIEEMHVDTGEAVRRQHHVDAVMGAIEKAATSIASDKVAEAKEHAEKAARDRDAAEKAQAKAERAGAAAPEAKNPVGGLVMEGGTLHASGSLKDGKAVPAKK